MSSEKVYRDAEVSHQLVYAFSNNAHVDATKKILIYGMNYAPEPTGVGRYSGEIGSYLAGEGHKVDVVTAIPHYPGWMPRNGFRNAYLREQIDGVHVTRCPLMLRVEMRGIWRLVAPLSFAVTSTPVAIWKIFMWRPDIVLCVEPTLFSAPLALFCAKLCNIRTVLHVQDLEVDAAYATGHLKAGAFQKIAMKFERALLRCFDGVVTISDHMKDKLLNKGVLRGRLHVVRNWVDLDKIKPIKGRSTYRDELALADKVFVAMYAGNVGEKQALSIVLNVAETMQDVSGLVFAIVGDGPEKSRLVSRYGHLRNVLFLPVQPEERLCELLNLADAHLLPQDIGVADLVLPSKLGGMLASEKPCIVMANPGTELFDFLKDSAIIIPPGDASRLIDALRGLKFGAISRKFGGRNRCIQALDSKVNLPAISAAIRGVVRLNNVF